MIKNRTLVVVGAGASKDLGLPLGAELKMTVAQILADTSSQLGRYIADATYRLVDQDTNRAEAALNLSYRYSSPIKISQSIDTFLDQHNENPDFVSVVKMALSYVIADSERNSTIGGISKKPADIILRNEHYFLNYLLNILVAGHQVSNVKAALENICFVVYNYDRCLERYLENWLIFKYGPVGAELARIPKIIHVYGSLGDYFAGENSDVFEHEGQFAFLNPHHELPLIAPRIRIFTEQEEAHVLTVVRNEFFLAETVIFLGFGFEPQNRKFFLPGPDDKKIFVTLKGVDAPNVRHIHEYLVSNFSRISRSVHTEDGTAANLFEHYRLPLLDAIGSF